MEYVERHRRALPAGAVRAGDPVVGRPARTELGSRSGPLAASAERFDAVVMATHADDALDCSTMRIARERAALGGFEYSTNQVVLHTDAGVLPRRADAPGRRGTSIRPTAAAGRGAHHDLSHEPAAVAGRARSSTSYRSTPATASRPEHGSWRSAPMQPSARTRSGRWMRRRPCAASRAGGRPGTPGPTRLRLPRGRLPVRVRGGRGCSLPAARRACGMRSHLLEGNVRHRRARRSCYALEHGVFYVALDLDELDEVPRRLRLIGRNRPEPPVASGTATTSTRRPWTCARPSASICGPRASIRTAGGSRSSPTCGSSAMSSTRPASTCAGTRSGVLQVVIVEVHNTHRERHLYTLAARGRRRDFVASMDKEFYVSPFIEMAGRYTVRVRDEPARLRIIDQRGPGRRAAPAHEPRPRAPAADRPDRRSGCSSATRS